jgi:hypothetical protein
MNANQENKQQLVIDSVRESRKQDIKIFSRRLTLCIFLCALVVVSIIRSAPSSLVRGILLIIMSALVMMMSYDITTALGIMRSIRPSKVSRRGAIRKSELHRPPGNRLLTIVDFLYSPKTIEETFKPIVADWRTEYFEALTQGRTWKARWISIRYTCSFIVSMSLSKVYALFKSFRSAGK